jgi:hypothetical protein
MFKDDPEDAHGWYRVNSKKSLIVKVDEGSFDDSSILKKSKEFPPNSSQKDDKTSSPILPIAEMAFETKVVGDKVVITGYTGSQKEVHIPARIDNMPVTAIGSKAFKDKQLTRVAIPSTVTSIGDSAFYYNKLTNVTIPGSVIFIGESAFSGNKLTSVSMPNSVTSIEKFAFANNKLNSVAIPSSIISIRNLAFYGNQLTNVTIGNNVGIYEDMVNTFQYGFTAFYNQSGKKTGTYTYDGNSWTYRN